MDLVYTTKGLIERSRLEMHEEFEDAPDHCVHAIVYTLNGEIVKRGVEVHIKQGLELNAQVGKVG